MVLRVYETRRITGGESNPEVCMITSVWYEGVEPGYVESRKGEIDVKISQLKPSPFVIHFQVF